MARTAVQPRRPLASIEEVSAYLGIEVQTLRNWRSLKRGPRSTKVGGSVRYRWADVDAYVDARMTEPEERRR